MPCSIADPSDYAQEDFKDKGLVIRRFKDDVREQLGGSFPEREISTIKTPASVSEEHLYELLAQSQFKTLKGTGAGQLFRTTLTKALSQLWCLVLGNYCQGRRLRYSSCSR